MKYTHLFMSISKLLMLMTSLIILISPSEPYAYRSPQLGAAVNVHLPQHEVIQTQRKHLYVPLLEPVIESEWVKNQIMPPLKRHPQWRSRVITDLRSQKGGQVWTIHSREPISIVEASLKDCLLPQRMKALWPSWIIRGLNNAPDFRVQTKAVRVQFQKPMPIFPALLAGCLYFGPDSQETGAYVLDSSARLTTNPKSLRPPLSITTINFLPNEEDAHIVGGSPEDLDGEQVLAPFPDVVLLLQNPKTVEKDPLLIKARPGGVDSFKNAVNPNAMLGLYWSGKGAACSGILPPGLGPPRPLPESTNGALLPLRLDSLPADAPHVAISQWPQDALTEGVFERMAVILRTQGVRAESVQTYSQSSDMEIIRWRPPVDDPALALLVLAGQYPDYLAEGEQGIALRNDPMMVSAVASDRMAAAVQWEQRWLSGYRVIPLMTAERWFVYKSNLEGVIIEADGLPRFENAYKGREP